MVQKPNKKLRICIDPQDLNKAIKREHYPLRTVEEVVAEMPNAKFFSVLDANHGFWQIQLDEDSSKLCTFNTPFGRDRFKKLIISSRSFPKMHCTETGEHRRSCERHGRHTGVEAQTRNNTTKG